MSSGSWAKILNVTSVQDKNVASRKIVGGHVHVNSYTYKPVDMCFITLNNYKNVCETDFQGITDSIQHFFKYWSPFPPFNSIFKDSKLYK